jgi:glycolate oxidase FAD binding subunit
MISAIEQAFFAETVAPADQAGVAEAVREAHEARGAVYPLGGRTALDYGIVPTRPGVGLDLGGLNQVVDYTPRDMTILVEAGVRMADLAGVLAAENQQLPIDVPRAGEATIGGVVATNWNGPRRYGYGTIRDYVIGIHAVDGRGVAFKGGGRVVKNVAGYDFCKLLTGSLGTLAVITQLAIKVKPLPERSATVAAACVDLAAMEAVLSRLAELEASPVTIDVLVGHPWKSILEDYQRAGASSPPVGAENHIAVAVRVEGTEVEVNWLAEQVKAAIASGGGQSVRRLVDGEAAALWARQVEFSDRGMGVAPDTSPLVLKIAVPPSAVCTMIVAVLAHDANCEVQAHAGNGIVYVRFGRFSSADLTSVLVGKLRPLAVRLGGSVVVVASQTEGLTPHMIWGGRTDREIFLERVKRQFDPRGILNPGRFIL